MRIALKVYRLGSLLGRVGGTVVAMVSRPWSLKFLWGPVIDRFTYRRWDGVDHGFLLHNSYGDYACGNGLMLLIWGEPAAFAGGMVLGVNLFASLQDVSVDALASTCCPRRSGGSRTDLCTVRTTPVRIGGAYWECAYCITAFRPLWV